MSRRAGPAGGYRAPTAVVVCYRAPTTAAPLAAVVEAPLKLFVGPHEQKGGGGGGAGDGARGLQQLRQLGDGAIAYLTADGELLDVQIPDEVAQAAALRKIETHPATIRANMQNIVSFVEDVSEDENLTEAAERLQRLDTVMEFSEAFYDASSAKAMFRGALARHWKTRAEICGMRLDEYLEEANLIGLAKSRAMRILRDETTLQANPTDRSVDVALLPPQTLETLRGVMRRFTAADKEVEDLKKSAGITIPQPAVPGVVLGDGVVLVQIAHHTQIAVQAWLTPQSTEEYRIGIAIAELCRENGAKFTELTSILQLAHEEYRPLYTGFERLIKDFESEDSEERMSTLYYALSYLPNIEFDSTKAAEFDAAYTVEQNQRRADLKAAIRTKKVDASALERFEDDWNDTYEDALTALLAVQDKMLKECKFGVFDVFDDDLTGSRTEGPGVFGMHGDPPKWTREAAGQGQGGEEAGEVGREPEPYGEEAAELAAAELAAAGLAAAWPEQEQEPEQESGGAQAAEPSRFVVLETAIPLPPSRIVALQQERDDLAGAKEMLGELAAQNLRSREQTRKENSQRLFDQLIYFDFHDKPEGEEPEIQVLALDRDFKLLLAVRAKGQATQQLAIKANLELLGLKLDIHLDAAKEVVAIQDWSFFQLLNQETGFAYLAPGRTVQNLFEDTDHAQILHNIEHLEARFALSKGNIDRVVEKVGPFINLVKMLDTLSAQSEKAWKAPESIAAFRTAFASSLIALDTRVKLEKIDAIVKWTLRTYPPMLKMLAKLARGLRSDAKTVDFAVASLRWISTRKYNETRARKHAESVNEDQSAEDREAERKLYHASWKATMDAKSAELYEAQIQLEALRKQYEALNELCDASNRAVYAWAHTNGIDLLRKGESGIVFDDEV